MRMMFYFKGVLQKRVCIRVGHKIPVVVWGRTGGYSQTDTNSKGQIDTGPIAELLLCIFMIFF